MILLKTLIIRMPFALLILILCGSAAAQTAPEAPKELLFTPVKIDGPVHDPANHTYWFGPFAECGSVLDINGDGQVTREDFDAVAEYLNADLGTATEQFHSADEGDGEFAIQEAVQDAGEPGLEGRNVM